MPLFIESLPSSSTSSHDVNDGEGVGEGEGEDSMDKNHATISMASKGDRTGAGKGAKTGSVVEVGVKLTVLSPDMWQLPLKREAMVAW